MSRSAIEPCETALEAIRPRSDVGHELRLARKPTGLRERDFPGRGGRLRFRKRCLVWLRTRSGSVSWWEWRQVEPMLPGFGDVA
jgi:hypothetical protein